MSLSIQGSPALQTSTPVSPTRQSEQKPAPAAQKTIIESDTLEKSALSGAVRGGLTTAGVIAVPAVAYMASQSGGVAKVLGSYIGLTAIGLGAVTGAVAGAVSSQTSRNPVSGAAVGALAGAASGATALGLAGRNLGAAGMGALVGGIAGLIGGAAGTYATEKK